MTLRLSRAALVGHAGGFCRAESLRWVVVGGDDGRRWTHIERKPIFWADGSGISGSTLG